ncbi:MAG TPA: arabinofuranosidase catalytic domain-containing protein [Arenicellales bacterium]|nr:arabinofuranosidase catalytic domain-containing protein [Arenicellales bacterium]
MMHYYRAAPAIQPPLLLDMYPATAAYSVARRLRYDYSGPLIRVRRSSDNAEQDIGFDSNGDLDKSALATFAGANDGFIVRVYEQTGNFLDISNSTAASQPQIVQAGTIITEGGKPTVKFDGVDDYLVAGGTYGNSLNYTDNVSWFQVLNGTSQGDRRTICDDIAGKQGYFINIFSNGSEVGGGNIIYNDGSGYEQLKKTIMQATTHATHNACLQSVGDIVVGFNGTTETLSFPGWDGSIGKSGSTAGFAIGGAANGNQYFEGNIQETVVYLDDQSANRSAIEQNQAEYYGITLP